MTLYTPPAEIVRNQAPPLSRLEKLMLGAVIAGYALVAAFGVSMACVALINGQ